MNITLLIALIALAGVIISTIISFLIANRTAKYQIKKVRYEIQHSKAAKITEKRIEVYPALYCLINELNFLIQENQITSEGVTDIYNSIHDWYLTNGIFLSSKGNSVLWELLKDLRKLKVGDENVIERKLGNHEQRKIFIKGLDQLELELKSDLGIYEIEFFDPDVKFKSYSELMSFYRESKTEKETIG